MGVDTKAAIFVGLPREEVDSELIENEALEVAPPHYDGNGEDYAIAGFALAMSEDYGASEFKWDAAKVEDLLAQFKELTGKDAKVWLSPYVY